MEFERVISCSEKRTLGKSPAFVVLKNVIISAGIIHEKLRYKAKVMDFGRGFGLNEEIFELEQEEQKKRATCKSTFFPAIFSFFKRGAQENSSEL